MNPTGAPYRGRFAPSPTGPLHAGSLVAALASWLDARAHRGRWLVRIEDVDAPRCPSGMDEHILWQLAQLGLLPDEDVMVQSRRAAAYEKALQDLLDIDAAYPCACSRREVDEALAQAGRTPSRHQSPVYPGTCRAGLAGRAPRAWRLSCGTQAQVVVIEWFDRRLGAQRQDLTHEVGDFVIRRADGLWAYQLAVVVDDAEQGITHVVRGEDLADNTPRQIHLQRLLGLPHPSHLHTPLVLGANGEKLSKQNGAQALDLSDPLRELRKAGAALGLPAISASRVGDWLQAAVSEWSHTLR